MSHSGLLLLAYLLFTGLFLHADQQQEADSVNAITNGGVQALTDQKAKPGDRSLSSYTLSASSSLEFAASEEFILKDKSPTWGHITERLTQGRADVPTGELRVQVGNREWGLIHAKAHEEQMRKLGFENAEAFIDHVFQNASLLLPVGDGKNFMVVERDGENVHPSAVIRWNPDGGFYSLTTAMPVREGYIKSQQKKSPLPGNEPQAPAPAQAPQSSNASTSSPEGNAELRYGNDDSNANNVALDEKNVNGIQALTSDSKRFFEPDMPQMSEVSTSKPVTIAGIREQVEKLLPWRHGKTGKGNLGIFKVDSEVARTKLRNDVPAILHELGHFLDKRLRLSDSVDAAIQQELASAGGVASTEGYTQEQVRQEGVAQFFLHYAINEDQARAQFPEYYKAFKEKVALDPELKESVDAIVERVSAYYRQSPADRLRSNIIRGTDRRPWSPLEIAQRAMRRFYDMFVDSSAPLQRVTENVRQQLGVEYLPDELNLYARARTSAGYMGKADQDIKPFLDVLRGLEAGDHIALSNYLAAARAQDYRTHDMEPGLGVSSAEEKAIIRETPERVRKAADELRRIMQNTVKETLVKAGIMSPEQFDYLQKKWPNYVPFFRVDTQTQFENEVAAYISGRGKKLVNLQNPVKKATGVGDAAEVYPIRDPLETMVQNIVTFHALAAKNEVGKTMINISQMEGMGEFAERVEGPGGKGDNVFSVWNDGKRQYYATDSDVYRALMAISEGSGSSSAMQKAMKILTVPANVFKMGTTRYNPAFIVRNFLRDSINTAILSESGTVPFANSIRGVMLQLSSDPKMKALIEEATEEGVLRSCITEIRSNSPRALAKQIENAMKEGGITADVRRKIGAVLNTVGSWNEAVELAPKLREYQYLRSQGVPKQEAAMRAREVNVDFARAGTAGRQVNRSVAFFNARVQGVDKALRTAAKHPVRTGVAVVKWGVLPSIAAWAFANIFGDEQERKEYEEIPRSMKDNFWFFKVGGNWVRLPKPDVFGLLGSLTERALDVAWKKDPAAFRGFGDSIKNSFIPDFAPTAIVPLYEYWANKSTFTGRPIVSEKYQDLPPEMQYGPYTSGIARALGDLATVSPMMIDHLIQGYSGTMGSLIMSAADPLLKTEEREAARVTEGVLARSLFASPYRNSESMDRFYELSEQTNHSMMRYQVNHGRGGITKEARFAGVFESTGKQIAGMRKARAVIQQNPNMDPHEKRYRMDVLDALMIDVARKALTAYDGFKE